MSVILYFIPARVQKKLIFANKDNSHNSRELNFANLSKIREIREI